MPGMVNQPPYLIPGIPSGMPASVLLTTGSAGEIASIAPGTGVATALAVASNTANGLAVLNASGYLAVGQGGTGLGALTAGYIPYGNGTGALNSSATLFYGSNTLQLTSGGSTTRLLYLGSSFNRSDIFFVAGVSHGIRFGAGAAAAQLEAVDYTGAASFSPLIVGGSTITAQIAGVAKLSIDANGNVYPTSGATGMTNGFFYIPSAAGAPSGTPTAISGRLPMYYDSTNNKFYIYNTAWKSVTLA